MSRYQQAPISDEPLHGYGTPYGTRNGNNAYGQPGNGAYGGYSDEPNTGYTDGYGTSYGNGGNGIDNCKRTR